MNYSTEKIYGNPVARKQKPGTRNLQARGHHNATSRANGEVRGMGAAAIGDAGVPRIIAPGAATQRATACSQGIFAGIVCPIRVELIETVRPFPNVATHIECSTRCCT